MTLNASLGEQPNAFLVPQAGLLRDATSAYVLVVGADGKVARKDVVADRVQGGNWVVSNGLAAGDRVIVSGVQRAKPGEPAKATPWTPEGAANQTAATTQSPASKDPKREDPKGPATKD